MLAELISEKVKTLVTNEAKKDGMTADKWLEVMARKYDFVKQTKHLSALVIGVDNLDPAFWVEGSFLNTNRAKRYAVKHSCPELSFFVLTFS